MFLSIFSYAIIFEFKFHLNEKYSNISTKTNSFERKSNFGYSICEYVVIIWVVSFFLEETRQVFHITF
jgi:hypothetical protein